MVKFSPPFLHDRFQYTMVVKLLIDLSISTCFDCINCIICTI